MWAYLATWTFNKAVISRHDRTVPENACMIRVYVCTVVAKMQARVHVQMRRLRLHLYLRRRVVVG